MKVFCFHHTFKTAHMQFLLTKTYAFEETTNSFCLSTKAASSHFLRKFDDLCSAAKLHFCFFRKRPISFPSETR